MILCYSVTDIDKNNNTNSNNNVTNVFHIAMENRKQGQGSGVELSIESTQIIQKDQSNLENSEVNGKSRVDGNNGRRK